MLHSLIAYDANGEVIATLDYVTAKDDDGNVVGLIDFEAHEKAGGKLRDVWEVSNAAGSATWPEWVGGRAHDFKVELDERKRIVGLIHKQSGHRRDRGLIEAEIASRIEKAHAEHRKVHGLDADVSRVAVDLRDVLGGPNRPLVLDENGRNRPKVKSAPSRLPVVKRERDLTGL